MDFISNDLIADEQVAYKATLHWVIFAVPMALLFGAWLFSGELGTWFLIAAVITGALSYLKYISSEFAVTNKRVIVKMGFIRRVSVEILLSKIEAIEIHQGVIGRILNYGTVVVRGTGGAVNSLEQIAAPLEFRKKTQEQIERSN